MGILHVLLVLLSVSFCLSNAEVLICLKDGLCASEGSDVVECPFVDDSETYVLRGTQMKDGSRQVQKVWKIVEKDSSATLSLVEVEYEQTGLVCEAEKLLPSLTPPFFINTAIGGSVAGDAGSTSDDEVGSDGFIALENFSGSDDFGSPEPLEPIAGNLPAAVGGTGGSGALVAGGAGGAGGSSIGKSPLIEFPRDKIGRVGGGSRSCSAQWVSVRGKPRMCCK
eukprot:TRINITY_DN13608_c0_g2_i1.p1 TRINITY_DN13608_c0_g2~~TRINITY_DN13608_c0_g2_i1.p1  ORF type:complete len:224 (-),score=37.47 TRINITY_DN13608_c0_g2_i1:305-976(-)